MDGICRRGHRYGTHTPDPFNEGGIHAHHEVLLASRQQAPLHVDIADPASIRSLYAKVGKVGAVISAAGQARFKPFDELSDADFRFSVDNKLMGQVNVVRYGLGSVVDGGSII